MARRPRVEYPGALYHVICRGNNGENILSQEKDKIEYIELLKKYKIRYGFNLYAYCIMDNHVHLLVETGVIPLSKIMQGIQQSFTQRYNKRYQRTGHVFQQRYKAQLCDKENYLLQLIKYIHHNPVKARISGLSYNWSSHYNYTKGLENSLVDVEFILNILSEDHNRAIKLYKEFMEFQEDELELEQFKLEIDSFEDSNKEHKPNDNIRSLLDCEYIINHVCEITGLAREDLIRRSRVQKLSDTRKVIVLLCNKYSGISSSVLANQLNIPLSMVSKIRSGDSKLSQSAELLLQEIENKGIIQA